MQSNEALIMNALAHLVRHTMRTQAPTEPERREIQDLIEELNIRSRREYVALGFQDSLRVDRSCDYCGAEIWPPASGECPECGWGISRDGGESEDDPK